MTLVAESLVAHNRLIACISLLQHRVKPFPDPERPRETKWMSKEDIHQEAMKPTTHWVESGSGRIGRIYLEVLGCDDLPNMDYPNPITNRITTDTFMCCVMEDNIVNTDVIANSTSPRWMPWCRRGFVFNVEHPSSNILVGVFDWDDEKSEVQKAMSVAATDVHDPIGRIEINVANAFPNTVYTITVRSYAFPTS